MTDYEYKKYCTDIDGLRATIDTYGVAIIPDVLDNDECEMLVDGVWNYFEHITKDWKEPNKPIDRNDKTTWREFYKLYPKHSMLIQEWNVGQAQVSWDFRQKEKLVDIFAKFWNCNREDLLVSFDGLSLNLPPEVTRKGWRRNKTWYHTDQSYLTEGFQCLQSWITGLDVNEGDETLSFYEGSNNYHHEFGEEFKINEKADWYKLNEEEEKFYIDKGCAIKHIKCPKGSMVFWDSRTIHCGIEPSKNRQTENIRAIVYLCYMPRKLCSNANLKKKQKAFDELRTTNHYPCKPKLFPKNPRTYGAELPVITIIDKPRLTDLGNKLAGF